MIVQSIKLRRLTIGIQLVAGIGLLTASYFTTDEGWASELLKATVYSGQSATTPTTNQALLNMKAGHSC